MFLAFQINNIYVRKFTNIFLTISFIICYGCSIEPSRRDGSIEYPQHMFWLRNKKIIFNDELLSKGMTDRVALKKFM